FVSGFGDDERGEPGEVVPADEEIEHGVAHAAGLADKGQPEIDVLFPENFNGLVCFFLNERHMVSSFDIGWGTVYRPPFAVNCLRGSFTINNKMPIIMADNTVEMEKVGMKPAAST